MTQEMMGFGDGSSISWTTCKQSAPHSRQITTPTSHYSIFTGRMLFLMPNQHCQSTEGMLCGSCPYQMVQISAVIDGPARRAASCTSCDAQCVKLAKVVGRTSTDRRKYSQLDRQKQKVYHTERPTRISQPKNNTRLTALCPGITRVSRYKKGKTNLDFTEARHSEWQWHQLGHMQVCTVLQTDNHASTSPLSLLHAGCPSCQPINSVKALNANNNK